jgi:hypothetical protein
VGRTNALKLLFGRLAFRLLRIEIVSTCAILRATKRFQQLKIIFLQLKLSQGREFD